jgi:phasin family protein
MDKIGFVALQHPFCFHFGGKPMLTVTQQVEDFTHASVESAAQFGQVALEGSARLLGLQLKTARELLADNEQRAKDMAATRDIKDWPALQASAARAAIEIGLAYARQAYEIETATRTELGKLLQKSAQEWQNNTKQHASRRHQAPARR